MPTSLPTVLLVILLVMYSHACFSRPLTELVEQAETAFRAQDYVLAIQYYEAALAQRKENDNILFNLAASHFRAKNFDQANRYFEKIADDSPHFATALLNRGIIALKKHDDDSARRLLNQVVTRASDTQAAQLARDLLSRIDGVDTFPAPLKPYFGFFSVGIGSEDSVLAPETETAIETQNTFAELNTFWSYSVNNTQFHETTINLGGIAVLNKSTPEYNFGVANIGAEHAFKFEQLRVTGGVENSLESLGDVISQGSSEIYFKARRQWTARTRSRLRYASAWIQAVQRDYEYNTGWRHRLRADTRHKLKAFTINSLYEYEKNARQNWRDTTEFRNYSPTRHTIRLRIDYGFSEKWSLQTTGEYRASQYSQDNVYQSVPVRRDEERLRGAFDLIAQWSETINYKISYTHQRNYSTIDIFDSKRNEITVSTDVIF